MVWDFVEGGQIKEKENKENNEMLVCSLLNGDEKCWIFHL